MKTFNLVTGLLLTSSLVLAPAAFAKSEHAHDGKHKAAYGKQYTNSKYYTKQKVKHDDDDRDDRYTHGRYVHKTSTQYQQLPPGLQKNVARGKAVPPGWAKKLDDRYYRTVVRNGQPVYILDDAAYRNARVIGYPRDGVVRVNVDNRTVEILEATRAILNVLN